MREAKSRRGDKTHPGVGRYTKKRSKREAKRGVKKETYFGGGVGVAILIKRLGGANPSPHRWDQKGLDLFGRGVLRGINKGGEKKTLVIFPVGGENHGGRVYPEVKGGCGELLHVNGYCKIV